MFLLIALLYAIVGIYVLDDAARQAIQSKSNILQTAPYQGLAAIILFIIAVTFALLQGRLQ